MSLVRWIFILLFTSSTVFVFGQDTVSVEHLASFPGKYYDKLSKKVNGLERQLDKQTEKYLCKIEKQEKKLYEKLWKKDSTKAKELFGDISERYSQLPANARAKAQQLSKFSKVYSSKLDSLSTTFTFLSKLDILTPEIKDKLKRGLTDIDNLQNKLDQTDQIRKYLKERKQILAEQLGKLGMFNDLKRFNKQLYYYQQQIAEYKAIINNPAKLEEKLLRLIVGLPQFKNFFATHSQIGSLFRMPGAPATTGGGAVSFVGLQTRTSVLQNLQTRFGNSQQGQQAIQQGMQSAQSQLNELKNKISQFLPQGGSSDEELPDFKPNTQKPKNFWKRVELGTNFQTQKGNSWLPSASDFGVSAGYRLNDKSIIGIGGSYRMGWGKDLRHIQITSQGAGLRSFLDWKIKGSFFLSGGFEMNFRSEFARVDQLRNIKSWQQSGLVGLSKVVSLNSKLFKKTKIQALWDFLSYQQTPRPQPLIIRFHYNF